MPVRTAIRDSHSAVDAGASATGRGDYPCGASINPMLIVRMLLVVLRVDVGGPECRDCAPNSARAAHLPFSDAAVG